MAAFFNFKRCFMPKEIKRQFEQKVQIGLNVCGIADKDLSHNRIGVAVSGGADSVSLLLSLSEILKKNNQKLYVMTINHNIRPENETFGDVVFVKKLCEKLVQSGYDIDFNCKTIDKKTFNEQLNTRKTGIEDTARFLRYQFFEEFINEKKLDYLCLAHNKNDQIETVLMRFLQGGNCESLSGIQRKRDSYIRPLLNIERKEIEEYLKELNQEWRTDKTNFDINYYRNNVRMELIPFIKEKFPFFDKSILTGIEKNKIDSDFIRSQVDNVELIKKEKSISIRKEKFSNLHKAIKIRVLIKMFNYCDENNRIPFNFIEDLINTIENENIICKKNYSNTEILIEKNSITVQISNKKITDFSFFDIIYKEGKYSYYFGDIVVVNTENGISINDKLINKLIFPFFVRNFSCGDIIKMSNDTNKKVLDIFYDWHIDEEKRQMIPIIEEIVSNKPEIKCILGSVYGFNDWIVK
jgi:tRNA(Ile)-lysidine synthase